jgi:hypothetical protein
MGDLGRGELMDAKAEWDQFKAASAASARVFGCLMDDRVRHLTALVQIARMTETGMATGGGYEVHRIARAALDAEADMSWWPEAVTSVPSGGDLPVSP